MNIRITETNDIQAIVELLNISQNLHMELYPNIFKECKEIDYTKIVEYFIKHDQYKCLCAQHDFETVGINILEFRKYPETSLSNARTVLSICVLTIKPAFQGLGIGKILINESIRIAKENKITEIEIDVWNKNLRAKNFYEKLGFYHLRTTLHKPI